MVDGWADKLTYREPLPHIQEPHTVLISVSVAYSLHSSRFPPLPPPPSNPLPLPPLIPSTRPFLLILVLILVLVLFVVFVRILILIFFLLRPSRFLGDAQLQRRAKLL